MIEQAKLTYSALEKALEKQTEKQVDALKFLSLSGKTGFSDELKQLYYHYHKGKSGKRYKFSKVSLSITFLKDIYTNILSIENADNKQNNLFK